MRSVAVLNPRINCGNKVLSQARHIFRDKLAEVWTCRLSQKSGKFGVGLR
jgi:hypothetical protein